MPPDPKNPNRLAEEWIARLRTSAIGSPEWLEAVDSLRELGLFVVPTLIQAWADGELAVRTGVTKALGRMGRMPPFDVIDALNHENPMIRGEAASFLYGPASQDGPLVADIVPPLIESLRDAESSVRVRAAQAIGILGAKAEEAVPGLIKDLRDEESYVRQWSAMALGSIGPKARAAIPALTEALLDDDEFVRDEASQALDSIQLPVE